MGGLDEEAKAVKAVAELSSDAIEAATKVGGFFTDLLGHGPKDWVALKFSDRQKFKRAEAAVYDWNNLIRVAHRVDSNLIRDGITQRGSISAKLGIEFIESASLEDNEDIQKLYAELYASALNPDAVNSVEIKHLKTLKLLTGTDLICLEKIYVERVWTNRPAFHLVNGLIEKEWIDSKLETNSELNALLSSVSVARIKDKGLQHDAYAIQSLINAGLIHRGLVDVNADLNKHKVSQERDLRYGGRRNSFHSLPKKMVRGSDNIGELTPYGFIFCQLIMPQVKPLKG